jgi:uncharacterized protein involved in exopolysaccharide biosynthesis
MFDAPGHIDGSAGTPPARVGAPLDRRRVTAVLRRHALRMLAATLAAAAVGLLLGKLLPKTYVATASVMWVPQRGDPSWSVVEDAMPTLFGSVTLPSNMLRAMDRLGQMNRSVDVFSRGVKVTSSDLSTVIDVAGKGDSPEEAAAVANTVAEVFIDQRRSIMARQLDDTVAALRASLSDREAQVAGARERYDAFRADNDIKELSTEEEAAIRELARLEVLEHDVKIDMEGAKAMDASLRAARAANPETVVTASTQDRSDVQRLVQLQTELAQARARFTPDHPAVKALQAQVDALRGMVDGAPARATSTTVGRGTVHDAVATQLEQAHASERSLEERQRTLTAVRAQADARARQLTAAEAQAARLLADVKVDEAEVEAILKQIAEAEADVRAATSDFQFVSRAIPPTQSSLPIGPLTAIAIPLLTLLAFLWRTVAPLRAKTSSELAYWSGAPVLWSSAWPAGPGDEGETLARELAETIEDRPCVVGLCSTLEGDLSARLARMIAEQLRARGISCGILEAPDGGGAQLANALQHRSVGAEIRELHARRKHVLFVLPPLEEADSVRAARRWLDALVVLVPSGEHRSPSLSRLRHLTGIPTAGLGVALVGVDAGLLDGPRTAGPLNDLWRARRAVVSENAQSDDRIVMEVS